MENRAVFLDRDGTINVDNNYVYKITDFKYMDGAIEGMKILAEMGYMLVIVSNQSGIARGYYTEEDLRKLDIWMKEDLSNHGIYIAATYYCPHLPHSIKKKYSCYCECRKPKTKLFWDAAKDLNINVDKSIAIGDKERDLSICLESKAIGILLSEEFAGNGRYYVCRNWFDIISTVTQIAEV